MRFATMFLRTELSFCLEPQMENANFMILPAGRYCVLFTIQQKPQAKRESVWIFVVVGLFGVVLLVLVRRWRAAGGSQ